MFSASVDEKDWLVSGALTVMTRTANHRLSTTAYCISPQWDHPGLPALSCAVVYWTGKIEYEEADHYASL